MFIYAEIKLLLLVLLLNVALYFKGVLSVVSEFTLRESLCSEKVATAALEILLEILKNKI